MLTNLMFLGILASGSAFCSVKYNKKFEEILPITCMGIGLILFLFGVAGALKAGSYFIVVAAGALYLMTLTECLKNKKSRERLWKNMITPGSIFFCMVMVLGSVFLYGQLAANWDEFSHWMDIAKVMTMLDDFGTNPQASSTFQSYPPGMVLFQYMFQKVYLFIKPEQIFSEWRVYLAYQLYSIAVLLPFFRNVKWGEGMKTASLICAIFCLPLIFFNAFYHSVYIDPFLGILAGAGFSCVIIYSEQQKDIFYSIYIWLLAVTLILSKDAGLLFAVCLLIFYLLDYNMNHSIKGIRKMNKQFIVHFTVSVFAVLIPKFLWEWHLRVTEAYISFETKIGWNDLLNVLMGKDDSYRSEVLNNYIYALFDQSIDIGYTGISLNYFMLLILLGSALYFILHVQVRRFRIKRKNAILYGIAPMAQLVMFIIGMCVIYMFNFSEYEAVGLASFPRYLNIAFLAISLMVVLVLWDNISYLSKDRQKTCWILLLCFIMLLAPLKQVVDVLNRTNFETASRWRSRYEDITNEILRVCDGTDNVYVIAQEDKGIDKLVLKYNVRPNKVSGSYSIGEPFYDGDIWTEEKTAEEWQRELVEGYDYVALYCLNDYFYENFSELFADPESIYEDGVYRVDKESGLLYLVN